MKTLGAVWLDLERNGLGLPSRAAEPFAGGTVLSSTLDRLARSRWVDQWVVVSPAGQVDRVRGLVPAAIPVRAAEFPDPPWLSTIRKGRKWSLGHWRGGLCRSSLLDEECRPADFARLAREHGAGWIVQARAEGPLVDPALIDSIVERALATSPPPPLVYPAIPPGLGAWALRSDFLEELAEKDLFPGYVLGYRAWEPTVDLTEQLFVPKPPLEISRLSRRLLCDHDAGMRLVRAFEREARDVSALDVAKKIEADPIAFLPTAPEEIEIEATTRRGALDRTRPAVDRPDVKPQVLERWMDEYARASDAALVVLGGRGDPLEHPQWPELVDVARRSRAYGVCLVTDGLALTPEAVERLADVDVVSVRLDAMSARGYATLRGEDRFAEARAGLERLLEARRQRGSPLVAVSIRRAPQTLGEVAAFYDEWSTQADGAFLEPLPQSFAEGQPTLLPVEPAGREPCRRIFRRLLVQSDGVVALCSEDPRDVYPLGRWGESSLIELWRQGPLAGARSRHLERRWAEVGPCEHCREWHRP